MPHTSSPSRRATSLGALLAALSLACSDGSSTGPTTGPTTVAAPGGATSGTTTSGGTTTGGSESTPTGAPAASGPSITFYSGANWGEVGTRIAFTPSVRVLDERQRPVAGVPVSFAVTSGGGTITDAEQVTDSRGVAMIGSWTLGTVPGPQTLTATTPGLSPVTLTTTAVAGAPARIVVAAGDGQTATVVTNVAVAPAVKVVDRFGNGLPRIEVQFASGGENGGALFRRFERTDADGVARVGAWMLGVRPGVYTMRVTALTLPAVELHATAVAGAPARLRVAAGDAQVAPAGSTLPIAPAVQVTDVWGNPLPAAGLSVTFTVRGESGTVTGAEQVTDANGVARAGSWTIGALTIGGGNLLTAGSPGLTSATFLATGR